jgi:hypothetical protein
MSYVQEGAYAVDPVTDVFQNLQIVRVARSRLDYTAV